MYCITLYCIHILGPWANFDVNALKNYPEKRMTVYKL